MTLILHKVTDDNILDKLINYIHKYVNVTLDCKKAHLYFEQVKIVLTAYHKGYFQFKICPHNNPTRRVSQACLDQNRLTLAGTNQYFFYPTKSGVYYIDLQLPRNMECTQCVLQWHYITGVN